MARTLELDTITEPSNSGTANITLSSNTTTTMPLVDINGGAIDGTTLGVASPSSVAATTLSTTGNATVGGTLGVTGTTTLSGAATVTGATTMNGDVTLGNASSDTVTVTGTMAGIDNKSGMTGEIRMWSGSSAPTGWLLCNGANYDGGHSDYAALYAIIAQNYGVGDTTTNDFNVPDMRGRMPVGAGTGIGGAAEDADGGSVPAGGSALTTRSLGEWTGAEVLSSAQLAAHTHTSAAHTHTGASHTHTGPSHTHTGPSHTHTGASHRHLNFVEGRIVHTVGASEGLNAAGDSTKAHYSDYTTPGAGGASGTGATGASGTGATGGTTPGAGGSTTPGASGSTGSTSKFTTPIMCVNFIIKT